MYGELQTSPPGLKPKPGTVLLASRLMALLNLKPGDSIDVGDATLKIAGEVVQEPDSGFNPFQLAPRLLMNTADVAATHAVQPGSRVTGAISLAARLPSLTRTKNGFCRSSNQSTAGTGWSRTKGRSVNLLSVLSSSCCFRHC